MTVRSPLSVKCGTTELTAVSIYCPGHCFRRPSWGLNSPGQLYVSVELGSDLAWAALFQWSWGQNSPGQLYV